MLLLLVLTLRPLQAEKAALNEETKQVVHSHTTTLFVNYLMRYMNILQVNSRILFRVISVRICLFF